MTDAKLAHSHIPRFISSENQSDALTFNSISLHCMMAHLYFSTLSRVKLLFVNAYVHKVAHTIICAMNKNTKIIFSQNLSHVI